MSSDSKDGLLADVKPDMNNPTNLPPLSVSILGVEPLDDFIREIADFVHHMIMTRPNMGPDARVEVEAKVGILKYKNSNTRFSLPVLVETSTWTYCYWQHRSPRIHAVLAKDIADVRFETNMSAVSPLCICDQQTHRWMARHSTSTTIRC